MEFNREMFERIMKIIGDVDCYAGATEIVKDILESFLPKDLPPKTHKELVEPYKELVRLKDAYIDAITDRNDTKEEQLRKEIKAQNMIILVKENDDK